MSTFSELLSCFKKVKPMQESYFEQFKTVMGMRKKDTKTLRVYRANELMACLKILKNKHGLDFYQQWLDEQLASGSESAKVWVLALNGRPILMGAIEQTLASSLKLTASPSSSKPLDKANWEAQFEECIIKLVYLKNYRWAIALVADREPWAYIHKPIELMDDKKQWVFYQNEKIYVFPLRAQEPKPMSSWIDSIRQRFEVPVDKSEALPEGWVIAFDASKQGELNAVKSVSYQQDYKGAPLKIVYHAWGEGDFNEQWDTHLNHQALSQELDPYVIKTCYEKLVGYKDKKISQGKLTDYECGQLDSFLKNFDQHVKTVENYLRRDRLILAWINPKMITIDYQQQQIHLGCWDLLGLRVAMHEKNQAMNSKYLIPIANGFAWNRVNSKNFLDKVLATWAQSFQLIQMPEAKTTMHRVHDLLKNSLYTLSNELNKEVMKQRQENPDNGVWETQSPSLSMINQGTLMQWLYRQCMKPKNPPVWFGQWTHEQPFLWIDLVHFTNPILSPQAYGWYQELYKSSTKQHWSIEHQFDVRGHEKLIMQCAKRVQAMEQYVQLNKGMQGLPSEALKNQSQTWQTIDKNIKQESAQASASGPKGFTNSL